MQVLLSKDSYQKSQSYEVEKEYPKARITATEKFLKSSAYKALEQAHLIGEGIVMREEEGETSLLDLDDATGASICKSYLCCIESLLGALDLPKCDRAYRDQFSHSYQELYK